MKIVNVYIFPVLIILLAIGFIIFASVKKEGFCACASGSVLRNGGCYSCEAGYSITGDYYNAFCVNGDKIKPAIVMPVKCS